MVGKFRQGLSEQKKRGKLLFQLLTFKRNIRIGLLELDVPAISQFS